MKETASSKSCFSTARAIETTVATICSRSVVTIASSATRPPKKMKLPKDQQDRDMIARELLVKFQMSPNHPLVVLKKAYQKFD